MRRPLTAALAALALLAAGCGGDGAGAGAGAGTTGEPAAGGTLEVYAATSLSDAFTELATTFEAQDAGWKVRLQFAGSDILAAQIREGAPADVYAAASPKYPDELAGEGLVDTPTPFAANSLVLIVPAGNPGDIEDVTDLRDDVKLVIGDESVPVGAYTRDVLDALGIDVADLNVVSEETNVGEVTAKVALGEADAGFVYMTDARAAGDDVEVIRLPDRAQPTVVYPIAAVAGADQPAARRWIDLVLSERGQGVLRGFGFEPVPSE